MSGSIDRGSDTCPNGQTLQALINLPPGNSLALTLRPHIEKCPRCQRVLDELTDSENWARLKASLREPKSSDELRILNRLVEQIEWQIESQIRDERRPPADFPATRSDIIRVDSVAGSDEFDSKYFNGTEHPGRDEIALPAQVPDSIGRYPILKCLGRGGTGVIYLAYDPKTNRNVALKVMLDVASDHPRLQREARAIARLQCDEVVRLYSIETAENGQLFLTMEYVPGQSLAERIADSTRLGIDQVVQIMIEASSGLQAAHESGIRHRDIKPGNILLDLQDRAKLVDFGLALISDAESSLTETGAVVGTLAYMSPEAASGTGFDERSDVYSLGCVLYEMLTGEAPFKGSPQQILRRIAEVDPIRIHQLNPRVPEDLQSICDKAMAKLPSQRYQSAQQFREDLVRFQQRVPVHAKPASRLYRVGSWTRRHRWQSLGLVCMVTALLVTILSGISLHHANLQHARWRITTEQRIRSLEQETTTSDATMKKVQENMKRMVEVFQSRTDQPSTPQATIDLLDEITQMYQSLQRLRPKDQALAESYAESMRELWNEEVRVHGELQIERLKQIDAELIRLSDQFGNSEIISAARADLQQRITPVESGQNK